MNSVRSGQSQSQNSGLLVCFHVSPWNYGNVNVRPCDAHAVKVAVNGRYTFCTRRRNYDLVEGLEETKNSAVACTHKHSEYLGTFTEKPGRIGRKYKDVQNMQKIMKL